MLYCHEIAYSCSHNGFSQTHSERTSWNCCSKFKDGTVISCRTRVWLFCYAHRQTDVRTDRQMQKQKHTAYSLHKAHELQILLSAYVPRSRYYFQLLINRPPFWSYYRLRQSHKVNFWKIGIVEFYRTDALPVAQQQHQGTEGSCRYVYWILIQRKAHVYASDKHVNLIQIDTSANCVINSVFSVCHCSVVFSNDTISRWLTSTFSDTTQRALHFVAT